MSASREVADEWPGESSGDFILSDSSGWIHLQDPSGLPLCRSSRNSNPEVRQRDRTSGRLCPLCDVYAREGEQPDAAPPSTCPECGIAPSSRSSQADIFEHYRSSHGRPGVAND